MHYLIVSFTHKNTNIETREQLSFNNDLEKENFLSKVVDCMYINEAILLSTCNRIELTASVSDIQKAKDTIFSEFVKKSDIDKSELVERADIHENQNAVHHLFTVVSSLDSLVVGETQIAGQFKDAFRFSHEKGFCSQKLARTAQFAFKCASEVRNATSLGSGSVSVASTAVSKAKEIFKDESNVEALVIGAGEMSELTVKHLLKQKFNVVIISRNLKKAQLLASTFENDNVEALPYDRLEELINRKRLLVTATSAPYPIITRSMIRDCGFDRYWFDIALPRDIEDMNINGVNIYAVDDLQDVVNQNLHLRAEQAKVAYSIVSKMTGEFYNWLNTLDVEPIAKALHLKAVETVDKKIQNAIKKGFIPADSSENITKLCQSVVTELLHKPITNLRKLSNESDSDIMIENIQKLFEIKEERKDEFTNYRCDKIL